MALTTMARREKSAAGFITGGGLAICATPALVVVPCGESRPSRYGNLLDVPPSRHERQPASLCMALRKSLDVLRPLAPYERVSR
jgi:hypothetical protein